MPGGLSGQHTATTHCNKLHVLLHCDAVHCSTEYYIVECILSFILKTYISPVQETQSRYQPSHYQSRKTSDRCRIWKGRSSARNATQRGDHSMLMDPQPERHSLHNS